jgi:sugar lactone lactonase YvrE
MKRLVAVGALALIWSLGMSAQQPPPAAPPPPACQDTAEAQFVCGQQGPEDLVVVPGSQWVVASAYAGTGGIYLIRTSDRTSTVAYPGAGAKERFDAKTYKACPGAPDAGTKAKFQTHGLYLLNGNNNVHRLFVVLHGGRESVEVFELDARPATPVLTWIGCAVAPDPIGLNSVRGLPDGGFIATNFLPRNSGPNGFTALRAGALNGELWEWHTATGWQKLPGSEASGANGLELSEDGKTLYVAAWGTQSFFRLPRGAAAAKREEVKLGFAVDNIRWARDGSILATGQGTGTTNIVKIDPKTLAVTEVLKRPDVPGYGAGTVAVEIGNKLWVGSFRGDRIAIFDARSGDVAPPSGGRR